jgi:ergothioneine biosynthesis protein EgtB
MSSGSSGFESLPGSRLRRSLFCTRTASTRIAEPLSPEDQTAQAMDDASPVKWHLAHTTWFFETFVLSRFQAGYRPFDPRFGYCFNSYYESEGPRHPRPARGILTRPSCDEIREYRAYVDAALAELFVSGDAEEREAAELIEIGIQHEQQHQELMLTDVLALFALNPLKPAYLVSEPAAVTAAPSRPGDWVTFDEGLRDVGAFESGFSWDNERPRHRVFLQPFRIFDRLVTNAEWIDFMRDGGYAKPTLWLSDGWATVRRENWTGPAYFEERDGSYSQMSLYGLRPVELDAPVRHISYFEADAFATWAGKRLPSEFEWEIASASATGAANDLGVGLSRPRPAGADVGLRQMFGDVWEWTRSAYLPYPGYRAPTGAIGEYNGKFMSGQMVLRGGSCVTPPGHVRASYRNFFYPHHRWQFSGLRLAEDVG